MSSWMNDFLDSTKELESPTSYFYWSLLTVISASVGKRIWVNRGDAYKLYPNIYTFIISKRSGLRKGLPISVAKKLAHEIGTVRIIDGQNTIQGVLKELSQVRTLESRHVIREAEGFLITGEFASFLIQDGTSGALTTLTDLYDTHAHENGFKKTLASQDAIELKSPCLTSLFASNETHFFEAVPRNAITGGFLARTFCIYEERRNTLNSLTKKVETKIDYLRIVSHLKELAQLKGEIIPSNAALESFDNWYKEFHKDDYGIDDETGTADRIGDNIWKAAMLIALSNSHGLEILLGDMDDAIVRTMETFANIKRLLIGGSSDNKNIKTITMRTVIAAILDTDPQFEFSRKLLLRKGAGIFGVYDLDETIEHLLQAQMITIRKNGQEIYYKLTEVIIRKHREIKSKENGH
jgi:hypothetical protein